MATPEPSAAASEKSGAWADGDEAEITTVFKTSLKSLGDDTPDEAAAAATPVVPKSETLVEAEAEVEVTTAPGDSPHVSVTTFEELNLAPDLLKGVYDNKFSKPSKVQATALPLILSGKNLIAQSQNGSGKTAAFCLGMLSRIRREIKKPQAIVVAPTRELALQILDVARNLGKYTDIKMEPCVKDDKTSPDSQIIIGTPGSVENGLRRNQIDRKNVSMYVLDEADHMIDTQSFAELSKRIKGYLVGSRPQLLLFSATYTERVQKFADQFAPGANKLMLKVADLSLASIRQYYFRCKDDKERLEVLDNIYGYLSLGQTVIFVNTRVTADKLLEWMVSKKHAVSMLRGGEDYTPGRRDDVMREFREGKTKVLITTNVLARGIDVLQVSLVINFDIPTLPGGKPDPETYLHRIGRTGRWDRKGIAVNFVHDAASEKALKDIEKHYGREIKLIKDNDVEELDHILKEKW